MPQLSAGLSQSAPPAPTTTSQSPRSATRGALVPDRLISPKEMNEYLEGAWQVKLMNAESPYYMAPEVADSGKGTFAGDVFSFGIVCAEIWLQRLPGRDEEQKRPETVLFEPPMSLVMMRHRVIVCFACARAKHAPHAPLPGFAPTHQQQLDLEEAPPELKSLVQRMLCEDPSKRPSLDEITAELQRLFDRTRDAPHELCVKIVVPNIMGIQTLAQSPAN